MRVSILGTRGIPARHGGFETFVQKLAPYLLSQGWDVTVYCQGDPGSSRSVSKWEGIDLVNIPAARGPRGTMQFDLRALLDAKKSRSVLLTLGYNTALFNSILLSSRETPNIINMDGIEWQRRKWSIAAKAWLRINERAALRSADQLIADHPEIERHLRRSGARGPITMIPYGAEPIHSADADLVNALGLKPRSYLLVIARPEPENSVLEIVRAFSREKRPVELAILGSYNTEHAYQAAVLGAASKQVRFLGAIYDAATVAALRFHCACYIHGHTVGGTNPALVEAMAAGAAVLAHDNRFNRWVAGPGARFFGSDDSCAEQIAVLSSNDEQLEKMRQDSRKRAETEFRWDQVLPAYEGILRTHAISG